MSRPENLAAPVIRVVPLSTLKPAPYNPRRIDPASMAALTKSLERFGLVEPIIWNERTGYVVGGHQRLEVLTKKRATETAVVVVDLDETDEKALNVALNSPHLTGQFTDDLEGLLAEIRAADTELAQDLRLEELGFLDIGEAWAGMPEFENEDQGAAFSVKVNFADEESMQRFAALVEQTVTPKTRSIWYPKAEIVPLVDKRYVTTETSE